MLNLIKMRHEVLTIKRTGEKSVNYLYESGFTDRTKPLPTLDKNLPWATLEFIADDTHNEYHVVNTTLVDGEECEMPLRFNDREKAEDSFFTIMEDFYKKDYPVEIVRLVEEKLVIGMEHKINEN